MKIIPDRAHASIVHAINSFSLTSKVILAVLLAVFSMSAGYLAYTANSHFLVEIPEDGGSLREGIVGTPRLINPILVQTEAGRDLVNLVYAGLMKKNANGVLVPDMASSSRISADSKTITFELKSGLTFHDGRPLTASDVVFTIQKLQDPALKSPRRAYWESVKAEAPNDLEVILTLNNRNPLEIMRETTLGIMPEHIWESVSNDEFSIIEFNTQPIGSGPYMISSIDRGDTGLASTYTLVPFKDYAGERAHIGTLVLIVYQNEQEAITALRAGDIDNLGALPSATAQELSGRGTRIEARNLPRVFAVFFNQGQSLVLADPAVRQALNLTAPRENIVTQILHGYAKELHGPFPAFLDDQNASSSVFNASSSVFNASSSELAEKILDKAGWAMGTDGTRSKKTTRGDILPFAFSIATSDVPDLKDTATLLKDAWQKLGAQVTINVFESGDLNQNIIRERRYDALLFGQVIAEESDLYAFWHSSQRKDPGLNVALYANPRVDKALESMRVSTSTDLVDLHTIVRKEFTADIPAVFLYSPLYIEAVPAELKGYRTGALRDPSERFIGANEWFVKTGYVWPWFVPQEYKK